MVEETKIKIPETLCKGNIMPSLKKFSAEELFKEWERFLEWKEWFKNLGGKA